MARTVARALLAGAMSVLVVTSCATSEGSTVVDSPEAVPAPEGIPGALLERAAGRGHTGADVDYRGPKPPSGGPHNPRPVPCQFYDTPIPDENAVHSLEHGAIWIAYRPDLPDNGKAEIAELVASYPEVMASPYPGLETPVVVAAWERRLVPDGLEDPRLVQFIETYLSMSTAPEARVPC
ncbi:MAG: DUF3105 domain-containing protein [Acidimicrobiia bacterium]